MADVELVIIGGGVAGLSAGLYAAWHKLDAVLLERMGTGGQLINVDAVENFPGFPGGIKGYELGPKLAEQAMDLDLRIEYGEATSLRAEGRRYAVETDGETFRARTVIIAVGSTLAKLGVPGEEEFEGRGVSSCAVCDAEFFRDQPVVVAGGGDSALDESLYLAEIAASVTILVRDGAFDGAAVLAERVQAHPKISVQWQTAIKAIEGGETVASVRARGADGGERAIPCGGVFVYAGLTPNTSIFADLLPLDPAGHIPVDAWMRTARSGVFAAGDIRQHSARQLVTCAGDGATAAIGAARFLSGEER